MPSPDLFSSKTEGQAAFGSPTLEDAAVSDSSLEGLRLCLLSLMQEALSHDLRFAAVHLRLAALEVEERLYARPSLDPDSPDEPV